MTISKKIQLAILSPIPGRIAEGIRKAQDDLVSARNPQLGKVRAELVDAIIVSKSSEYTKVFDL